LITFARLAVANYKKSKLTFPNFKPMLPLPRQIVRCPILRL